jgi:uncharacterized membrane protein HdeD (DUF308 family)
MSNIFFLITVKYIPISLILGYFNYDGVTTIARALDVKLENLNKWKLVRISILFYFSIFLFYHPFEYPSKIYKEVAAFLLSPIIGILWTWIFLASASSIGKQIKSPRLLRLWGVFSIMAFGIYAICKAIQ